MRVEHFRKDYLKGQKSDMIAIQKTDLMTKPNEGFVLHWSSLYTVKFNKWLSLKKIMKIHSLKKFKLSWQPPVTGEK